MGTMRGWLSVLLAVSLVLAGAAAEAQRRGRRSPRRTSTPTESAAASSTPSSVPPPDPFADPESPSAASSSGTSSAAPSAAPPAAPPVISSSASSTTAGAGGSGSSSGASPAPAAAPSASPQAAADPGPIPPDLAPLRQEYVAIVDEMVQARSRIAILGQELFETRMTVLVHDRTGDEASLARFVVELDGTPVHRSEGEIEGGDRGRQVFEGALAPGPHVLTVELEQRARDDPEYRVTQRESFRFVVVRERLTEVSIELEDDTDIARAFRAGGEGRFEIRTRVRVATRALPRS